MASLADKYPRIADMKAKALKRMPHFSAEYLLSGTGYDRAMEHNQNVLKNIFLTPRYVKGTVKADLRTKIFNRTYNAPFGIAPVGMTSLIWPGAEIDLAKLANNENIPYTLSTVACASIEKVSPHLNGRGWFQLYPPKDKIIRDDLLKRAMDSGYEVLVITADIPASSRRERLRMAGVSVPPKINLRTIFQAAISPSWSLGVLRHGMPQFGTMDKYQKSQGNKKLKKGYAGSQMDRYLDWEYIEEVKKIWKGPVVLKGLMDNRDALKAKDYVDGIYLSNHGGRQLDIAPSPLQVLPQIRKELGNNYPIIIDSGFYSGQDVTKGLILGADFVMIGRPFIIGVAAIGSKGAAHSHYIIKDEIENIMEQVCAKNITELKNQKISLGKDFFLNSLE
ncbi:MAG: alpha-hydroxy-acid oxidizing protein [Pelagibacterales bacterium]|nr:alpha-hydroxy-acid oxidizing protein [Pelagibacterales bacterium]